MFCRLGLRAGLLLVLGYTSLFPQLGRAANWLPFGPDGGDARRIKADPSDHTHLYLGTVNGWIYESHDSGGNWHRLSRVAKRDDLVLDNIMIDQHDPRHLIVGAFALSHSDGGLFISHDAGKSWTSQAEMQGQSVRSLAVAPNDPKMLIAGTLRGVFRSEDGGSRWRQISPVDSTELHEVESVAVDPNDSKVIYAGTWHLPWKTTDGGEHWSSIKEGIIEDSDVFSIIIDPENPKTVYASACSGIYKSENGGDLFHKIQGIPSTARRTRVLLQDPNRLAVVFAGTTEGLWRTDDSGKTWTRLTGPEVIVNDVEIDRSDSKKVLIATDRGGVLASEDGGATFQPSNTGFSTRQITALKRDAGHPAHVLVGVVNDKEWGGIFESDNGGVRWQQLSSGLGGRDVFSIGQAPDGTMLTGTSHGIFRLDQSAGTWLRVEATPTEVSTQTIGKLPAIAQKRPVVVNRSHYARSVAAQGAKKSSPAGRKVRGRASKKIIKGNKGKFRHPATGVAPTVLASTTMSVLPKAGTVSATPAGPHQATTPSKGFNGSVYSIVTSGSKVLAATSIGLMSSSDDGLSWVLANAERSESWRFLAAARSSVVAASLYGLSSSSDGGATWSTVPLPEGLTQVTAIATVPNGEIWVGGREGVYTSSDVGRSWSTPKNLFVNAVNSIFYDDSADRMMVTTDGFSSVVFLVQLPTKTVTFADTGWSLRFARPMGDYLIAATLYDGIVIQPQMVVSPMQSNAAQQAVPQTSLHDVNGAPSSR